MDHAGRRTQGAPQSRRTHVAHRLHHLRPVRPVRSGRPRQRRRQETPGAQYLHYERCGFGYDENGVPYNDDGVGRRAVHVPLDANGTIWGTDAGAPNADETTDLGKVPTEYVLFSIGPDRTHRTYLADGTTVHIKSRWSVINYYDPTNGTLSQGNVVRFPGGLTP